MVFSEAGRVTNIRSVIDHETGKPKGYAFVEFEDASDALVAIRNLNGYEVNGRQVNFKLIKPKSYPSPSLYGSHPRYPFPKRLGHRSQCCYCSDLHTMRKHFGVGFVAVASAR
jgi:RNA recognition motif-containing protein